MKLTDMLPKQNKYTKKSRHTKSLFITVVVTNIISILLLSVCNYVVFYNISNKAVLKKFMSYNQRVQRIAFENIDRQIIDSAVNIPAHYFSANLQNNAVLLPQTKDISRSPADIVALTGKLSEISSTFPGIRSMDIYYPGTQTVVTAFKSVHFIKNDSERNRYLPWYAEFEKRNVNLWMMPCSTDAYPAYEPTITYITKVPQLSNRKDSIVVALHISPASFVEYIDENLGHLILANSSGEVIYETSAQKRYAADVLKYISTNSLSADTLEEPFDMKSGDDRIVVSSATSNVFDIQYFYIVPDHSFYSDYNPYLRMFIFNGIFSIIANIAVIIILSYRNNRTYHKRVMILSKNAGVSLDENSESIDASISSLVQTISSLSSTIETSRPVLFQNLIRSLIFNRNTVTAFEQLKPQLQYSHMCCVIIDLNGVDTDTMHIDVLQHMLEGNIAECNLFLTSLEKDQIIIVAVYDDENAIAVRAQTAELLDDALPGYHAVSGNSYAVSRDNFKSAFDAAEQVHRYRYIFTEEKWLCYEDIQFETRKNTGSHLKLFAELEKDIKNESYLDFKQHLYILIMAFKAGNYSIDYCVSTLRDLVTLMYQMVQQCQLDMWIVFGYDIRGYYKQIPDIDAFGSWMSTLCEILLQNIIQRKKSIDTDLQSKLIALIDKNLENDISLEFLSDQLLMRPDVLSRMFKQLIGRNYSDYIKDRKLARAVELLKEKMSVKDIAQKLGYNSTQYFIKIFKSFFGETPYQYYKKQQIPEQRDEHTGNE